MRLPVALIGLAVTAMASAQSIESNKIPNPPIPQGAYQTQKLQVPTVTVAPKIDGVLDDECWKTAVHVSGFYRLRATDPVTEQTEAWVCQDGTHLYIAVHCLDSHPELIKSLETQREGDLSHDDIIQIVLDSQNTRHNCSQFNVSYRGTQQTQLEGGTADNIKWAGDWKAATKPTADGWDCEMSIPYALLRYPKGTTAFGFAIARQIARETNPMVWPYIPKEGNSNVMPYLCNCCGLNPPYIAPRLVALPYTLGTLGTPSSGRLGVDLKYPVTTSIEALGTLYPDFQTVEQSVQDLSFSYTEKFLPDRRPFFVEGSQFMSDPFLFYSQRIPNVDEGVKVVGKQGPTTISALATNAGGDQAQTASYAGVSQELGLYSNIGATVLSNTQAGLPTNRLNRFEGNYGYVKGGRTYNFYANTHESWLSGGPSDYAHNVNFNTYAGPNKPQLNAFYSWTGKDFSNELGLVPEVDSYGRGLSFFQYNTSAKGKLETSVQNLWANSYNHVSGGFFHDDQGGYFNWGTRNGWLYETSADFSKYQPFVDHTYMVGIHWNQKTLVQQGGISYNWGKHEDQDYKLLTVNQGVLFSRAFTLALGFSLESLGSDQNTQTIVTGTYRINPDESIGGRIVQQNSDINMYLSFGRRARNGADVFFILGDPNAPRTRLMATLKIVHPL